MKTLLFSIKNNALQNTLLFLKIKLVQLLKKFKKITTKPLFYSLSKKCLIIYSSFILIMYSFSIYGINIK